MSTKANNYYQVAIEITDVKGRLNTSFGGFNASFYSTNVTEALKAVEELEDLIKMRENQIREAKKLISRYAKIAANGGPEAYAEAHRAT